MNRSLTKNLHHRWIILGLLLGILFLSGCEAPTINNPNINNVETEQTGSLSRSVKHPAALNGGDGQGDVPLRITIESIDLDTSVEELGWRATFGPSGRIFNNWDVTAYAAGWHVNSAKPGQGGNVVLSGHNNIQGAVFKELDQLQAGDVATIWSGDNSYTYEIADVFIVPERDATDAQRRQNARWIGEFEDERLTLVTCWPRNGNSHRIIAIGHRINEIVGVASTAPVVP